ncbi:pentapeptide repeat-containing protein [Amycolatopsis sp. A133]|uniref:pentapeptide repeat-containing protein n=1 Tax=Amycolatopsis sp. A133 TaxID=3064472 RepID=UPI0027F90608|nr:pentapeptide repeat-containing protein [Amycolatopsis sp. A133]MDQ7808969.1 pentapeptide repeat-containing protein [Amycolatopsis sp. A133]
MSTVTPFAILALIGAVSGSVTAWLLLRRDRPAEVLTPSAPPEPMDEEVVRQLVADELDVRLAGLHEFAELADHDPSLRQNFVDQFFVQLGYGWRESAAWQAKLWPVLLTRLRRESPEFWPEMDLHPESMVLHEVDLRGCEVRNARFDTVRFVGDARFDGAVITGPSSFEGSCFARHASFAGARFEADTDFERTTFTGTAAFPRIITHGQLWFDNARFSARTDFTGAAFGDDVTFEGAGFAGPTTFRDTRSAADVLFGGARFSGHADFAGAAASEFALTGASARTDAHVRRTWPPGWELGPPRPRKPGHWADLTRP